MSDVENDPSEVMDESVPADAIDESELDDVAGGVAVHEEAS